MVLYFECRINKTHSFRLLFFFAHWVRTDPKITENEKSEVKK